MTIEQSLGSGERIHDAEWFKQESLRTYVEKIHTQTYPDYPDFSDRLSLNSMSQDENGKLVFPDGSWWVYGLEQTPAEDETIFADYFDSAGRPLHPWFIDLITNPDAGVLCGKGFYWKWGPNYTGDPIVLRHDLDEPHILLIERGDGTGWALPGGFIETDKQETGIEAAIREAAEETGKDFCLAQANPRLIYQGPVVDLRMTAHAWVETTAVRFDLPDEIARLFPDMQWKGEDDAQNAGWFPVSQINSMLFGSHNLLIQKALGEQ